MKVLIAGAGKLGMRLARSLNDEDVDVTIIDNNPAVIDKVNNELDVLTSLGNALDFDHLIEIGIASYDLVIGAITSDESNVILTSIAKKLGCKQTIARVSDPVYHRQLTFIKEELGIDYIINPDFACAKAMRKFLLEPYNIYGEEFADGQIRMMEFFVEKGSKFIGKQLSEVEDFNNILISAISRRGKLSVPHGTDRLQEDDVIIVSGMKEDIENFDTNHSEVTSLRPVRSVLILGGGKLGFYLARLLLECGIQVTIIEQNYERAEDLEIKLPNALIIHGDGTDFNTMNLENYRKYDAFVGASGFDETNILMALTMKEQGLVKSIAKTSRGNYASIMDTLHLDAFFNPSFITAGIIMKVIRGATSENISFIHNGDAEITQILLDPRLDIIGKPLKDVPLPEGLLISAVLRDGEISIPNGNTILQGGDRLIMFVLHKDIDKMKKIFTYRSKGGFFSEFKSIL